MSDVFPENTGFQLIPVDEIDPNPYQPRAAITTEQVADLCRDLAVMRQTLPETCGLMQIPVGRLHVGRVQLAFGHRRLEAFKSNDYTNRRLKIEEDWSQMPVRLMNLSDEEMYSLAVRENADRQDLNDIEKARAIKTAVDEFEWPLERAAGAHGLSKSAGSNLTRLLQLPGDVQNLIAAGELGQRHGRELVRLMQFDPPMTAMCQSLARIVIQDRLTADGTAVQVDRAIEGRYERDPCPKCGERRVVYRDTGNHANECENCGATWRELADFTAEVRAGQKAAQGDAAEPAAERPHLAIWEIESKVKMWLNDPFRDERLSLEEKIETLDAIKAKEDIGKWHLEQIVHYIGKFETKKGYDIRAGDLRQACNNVLEQLKQQQSGAMRQKHPQLEVWEIENRVRSLLGERETWVESLETILSGSPQGVKWIEELETAIPGQYRKDIRKACSNILERLVAQSDEEKQPPGPIHRTADQPSTDSEIRRAIHRFNAEHVPTRYGHYPTCTRCKVAVNTVYRTAEWPGGVCPTCLVTLHQLAGPKPLYCPRCLIGRGVQVAVERKPAGVGGLVCQFEACDGEWGTLRELREELNGTIVPGAPRQLVVCSDCGQNRVPAIVVHRPDGDLVRCEPCRLKAHNEQMAAEHGPEWNRPERESQGDERRQVIIDIFSIIVERATSEQLTEIEAWLDDFRQHVFRENNEPAVEEVA